MRWAGTTMSMAPSPAADTGTATGLFFAEEWTHGYCDSPQEKRSVTESSENWKSCSPQFDAVVAIGLLGAGGQADPSRPAAGSGLGHGCEDIFSVVRPLGGVGTAGARVFRTALETFAQRKQAPHRLPVCHITVGEQTTEPVGALLTMCSEHLFSLQDAGIVRPGRRGGSRLSLQLRGVRHLGRHDGRQALFPRRVRTGGAVVSFCRFLRRFRAGSLAVSKYQHVGTVSDHLAPGVPSRGLAKHGHRAPIFGNGARHSIADGTAISREPIGGAGIAVAILLALEQQRSRPHRQAAAWRPIDEPSRQAVGFQVDGRAVVFPNTGRMSSRDREDQARYDKRCRDPHVPLVPASSWSPHAKVL